MLESRRHEGIELLAAGHSPAQVARLLSVSRTAVGRWRRRADSGGPSSLRATPRPGRPPRVDRRVQARLGRVLAGRPRRWGAPSGRWTLSALAEAVEPRWGYRYSRGGIWRILRAQGFRWRPGPRAGEGGSKRARAEAESGEWVPGRRVLALLYSSQRRRRRRSRVGPESRGKPWPAKSKRSSRRPRSRAGQVAATEKRYASPDSKSSG